MSHVGTPSVRGMFPQYEQANYTSEKALYEMVDNAILRAHHLQISITDEISVSDDIVEGFEDLLKEGTANPFNFTHKREGQNDDKEISQFGVGLKAGAIALAGRLDIYTLVSGQPYRIIFDFQEMYRLDTFEPVITTILLEEYNREHPFSTGSTLLFSKIRQKVDAISFIPALQETYGELLRKRPIDFKIHWMKVTEGIVDDYSHAIQPGPCLYTHRLCEPFTQTWTIYKNKVYFIQKGEEYEVFDKELLKKRDRPTLETLLDGAIDCGKIQSTMTKFYHDQEGGELPYNSIRLYRNDRCYGKWDHTYKTRNGAKNYVQSRIDIRSKELAKELGLTFNKMIAEDMNNPETQAFKEFIKHVTKGFNTDSTSPAFVKLVEVATQSGILSRPESIAPMTRVKYLRGDVPDASRLSMAEYIQEHQEIAKEKEFKTLFNRMIQHGWIPSPETNPL